MSISPFGPFLMAPGRRTSVQFIAAVHSSFVNAITLPAAIQAGDLLVNIVICRSGPPTTPSGWTLAGSGTGATGSDEWYIYTKVAGGAEGGTSPTFNSSIGVYQQTVLVYRNVKTGTTVNNVTVVEKTSGQARSFTTGGSGGDMRIAFAMASGGTATYTSPAGYTTRQSGDTAGSARQTISDSAAVTDGAFSETPAEITLVGGFNIKTA